MKAAAQIESPILSPAEEIIARSFSYVDFDVAKQAAEAMRLLRQLITEPESYREQWLFDLSIKRNGKTDPDDGLLRRDGEVSPEGETYDRKFTFMWRPRLMEMLRWRGVDDRKYQPFHEACKYIYHRSQAAFLPLTRDLDRLMPGYDFSGRFRAAIDEQMDVVRLNVYDVGLPEGTIGKRHTDRNFGTLHFRESRPGMRYGDTRTLYHPHPGKAIIFTGKKMAAITGGKIPALAHEATETQSDGDSRDSGIYFGHIVMPEGITIPGGR